MDSYIQQDDQKWFSKIKPYLYGRVLKVGNGLGYLSSEIKEAGFDQTVIDVQLNDQAINKSDVRIYNGRDFPFADQSFECVVAAYVLHHTPDPAAVFGEMARVANRVILIEETYENIFAKLDLVYRDVLVNTRAGALPAIYWGSYFSRGNLQTLAGRHNLVAAHYHEEKKRTYWKELHVFDRNS